MTPVGDSVSRALRSPDDVRQALEAFSLSRLMTWAVSVGLFEAIGTSGTVVSRLASSVEIPAEETLRFLRALDGAGLLLIGDESNDPAVALTESGRSLLIDTPGSLAGAARFCHDVGWKTWSSLTDAASAVEVGSASTAFDLIEGAGLRGAFEQQMHASTIRYARGLATLLASLEFERLIDVGGGSGAVSAALLALAPARTVTVMDRGAALPAARATLAAVSETGWSVEEGDFLSEVPRGADCLLLSRILHDWNDEMALTILRNCARAVSAGSWLVVFEKSIDAGATDDERLDFAMSDLNVWRMCGGAERTREQFRALLKSGGFTPVSEHDVDSKHVALVAVRS